MDPVESATILALPGVATGEPEGDETAEIASKELSGTA
jgi:hypothetical protein